MWELVGSLINNFKSRKILSFSIKKKTGPNFGCRFLSPIVTLGFWGYRWNAPRGDLSKGS